MKAAAVDGRRCASQITDVPTANSHNFRCHEGDARDQEIYSVLRSKNLFEVSLEGFPVNLV
jgi:hypothetical protein